MNVNQLIQQLQALVEQDAANGELDVYTPELNRINRFIKATGCELADSDWSDDIGIPDSVIIE